nr:hypothetical protein Itr_chr11CG19580 [Ipomoea trifida]
MGLNDGRFVRPMAMACPRIIANQWHITSCPFENHIVFKVEV